MKILKQSPLLKEHFDEQVNQKVTAKRQAVNEKWGSGVLGAVGAGLFQFEQMKNQIKGGMGENLVSMLAMSLPDHWIMVKNALIPTTRGKLTEIDVLLIGEPGVFLIEVKTWKGSWTAYRDNWKRREGRKWIPTENSPTQQSLYHQKMFSQWLNHSLSGFNRDLVMAPVVFPVAQWVRVKQCSVPVCHGLAELRQLLTNKENQLNLEQIQQIATLIVELKMPLAPVPQKPLKKPAPILRKRD
ncbi:MAG: nuclease-related domain-containing protein [Crocosphaera sp.]